MWISADRPDEKLGLTRGPRREYDPLVEYLHAGMIPGFAHERERAQSGKNMRWIRECISRMADVVEDHENEFRSKAARLGHLQWGRFLQHFLHGRRRDDLDQCWHWRSDRRKAAHRSATNCLGEQ